MTGAVAWQSSDQYGHYASRGIDGNINSEFNNMSCFHTDEPYSFWGVELTHVAQLGGAVIYYRSDECCSKYIVLLLVLPT